MKPPHTYTYRQSELPPMTAEIENTIAEIDFHGAEFIITLKGHYFALSALAEVLANLLTSAEMNLNDIRVIPDEGETQLLPRAIGLTDLPRLEKQLFISTAITSTVAIKVIASFMGCSFDQAASYVSDIGQKQLGEMSLDQLEMAVAEIAEQLREKSHEETFVIKL